MTGRRAGTRPPLEISFRDPKPIAAAVIVPSLIYAFVTGFLLAAASGAFDQGWWERFQQLATVLGRGVIAQQGWMFGILITMQLGCLLALLGGQIKAESRRIDGTLRNALSLFSVLPVIALSPALTVAVIAAFRVSELRGSLFVIVPALALTVGLSIFIGALEKTDDLTKLEMAREDELRALMQLMALRVTRGAPFAKTVLRRSAVLILVAIAGALVLNAVSVGFPWPAWVYVVYLLLIGSDIPATVIAIGAASATLKPVLSVVHVVTALVMLVAVVALNVASVMILLVLAWQFGVPFVLVGLLLLVDTIRVHLEAREVRRGRRPAGFWRRGGALARAGSFSARKVAVSDRDSARKNIEALKNKISRRHGETQRAESP